MSRPWIKNLGRLPEAARGKRVEVQLRTGKIGKADPATDTPPGWAADGKGGCRWTLNDPRFDPSFDIIRFRVL